MGRRQAATSEPCEAERKGKQHGPVRRRRPSLILYLDTSALIKLLIEEEGTAKVQTGLEEADVATTSRLTYVETHSALARVHAAGRLNAANRRKAFREFDSLWANVAIVEVDETAIGRAADLAARHVLRAYDAVQLASATLVAGAEALVFACWDEELNAAAVRERLTLFAR